MTFQIAVSKVTRNEAGIAALLPILAARFGARFTSSIDTRRQHAATTTWLENQPADAVVFVETTEEVADIVKLCAEYRVPVIPFGVGSSLEGHVNAPGGGITIDLGRMNRVLAVHAEDLDCVIEPGVTRSSSTNISATAASSSRSIPAPTRRSAAWRRRGLRAPMRSATGRCVTMCLRSPR
jgi:D-lactate dehydrogenase (cytochrome)